MSKIDKFYLLCILQFIITPAAMIDKNFSIDTKFYGSELKEEGLAILRLKYYLSSFALTLKVGQETACAYNIPESVNGLLMISWKMGTESVVFVNGVPMTEFESCESYKELAESNKVQFIRTFLKESGTYEIPPSEVHFRVIKPGLYPGYLASIKFLPCQDPHLFYLLPLHVFLLKRGQGARPSNLFLTYFSYVFLPIPSISLSTVLYFNK